MLSLISLPLVTDYANWLWTLAAELIPARQIKAFRILLAAIDYTYTNAIL